MNDQDKLKELREKELRQKERLERVSSVKRQMFNKDNTTHTFRQKKTIINLKVDNMDFFPRCHTEGSIGYDLYSAKDMIIPSGETVLIPTGVSMQLPSNMEAQIRPRSSSLIKGILIGFGTIDSDFRGEIHIIARNLNANPFTVSRRDRLAQLCFATAIKPILNRVEELNTTARGEDGFGSTGE